jgi:hypothetical protein
MALLTFLTPERFQLSYTSTSRHLVRRLVQLFRFVPMTCLNAGGYTRTKDGGFASKLRSQLNRLVALHRTELVFAQSLRKGNNVGAKGLFCLFFAQ